MSTEESEELSKLLAQVIADMQDGKRVRYEDWIRVEGMYRKPIEQETCAKNAEKSTCLENMPKPSTCQGPPHEVSDRQVMRLEDPE